MGQCVVGAGKHDPLNVIMNHLDITSQNMLFLPFLNSNIFLARTILIQCMLYPFGIILKNMPGRS